MMLDYLNMWMRNISMYFNFLGFIKNLKENKHSKKEDAE